ncbi:peptidoglycan-binding protein [Hominifimenecus sp. rT4P-3]|uniref:peptidoglycan-binding protein n=1 Tax=Hominifimenecus sp. rT4P-3 TaxID=3242979 RepID=UPI003DA35807
MLTSQELPDSGYYQVNVVSDFTGLPISGAQVEIQPTQQTDAATVMESLSTDTSGQTETISLPAPPLELSMEPGDIQPFAEYSLRIRAEGYQTLTIQGSEVFSGEKSLQTAILRPLDAVNAPSQIDIPPNTLFGDFPPKIAEEEIKPTNETGEIVLSRVVVPETVVVHDGVPSNSAAQNYFVPYKDYIKNVASCEIYSTWPKNTITANILAIMSFTLNRVYTEWYRNKGYDFTITTSTAYDQKYVYGRPIFDSISEVVDEIFTAYLSRPDVKQPIFTQYCDGKRVTCPNWLSQWGSKALGDQGYTAIEILRNYYGSSIYINTAEEIAGIPYSWPGTNLDIGSSGQKVYQLQEQLNTIGTAYPAIPSLVVDGIYGEATKNAVRTFQSVFGLPATGITDYATWFKISEIFVGVSKIAERA